MIVRVLSHRKIHLRAQSRHNGLRLEVAGNPQGVGASRLFIGCGQQLRYLTHWTSLLAGHFSATLISRTLGGAKPRQCPFLALDRCAWRNSLIRVGCIIECRLVFRKSV